MRLSSWLDTFRHRIASSRQRQIARSSERAVEVLETRTLLSVTAFFFEAENRLQVSLDSDDSVRLIGTPPIGGSLVEEELPDGTFSPVAISIIGTVPNITASDVEILDIDAGDGDNTIDLTDVMAGAYSSLLTVNVVAGDGDDNVIGSAFSELIDAGDGDDTVDGGDGDDTILAGNGDDSIIGGSGDDSIIGDDGSDTITGGLGQDTITGDDNRDFIDGGDDDDVIDGGSGADEIQGGAGNDSITAGSGNDSLTGGLGDDTLLGDSGADTINGGDGDDCIFGGSGEDLLMGEIGDDTIRGESGNDVAFGGFGNDSLIGNSGDDFMEGGFGDDKFFGGAGKDSLFGQDGADTMLGQGGNDLLFDNVGTDSMNGGPGNDVLDSRRPTVSINDVVVTEGDSGFTQAVFTVTLSIPSSIRIFVSYQTMSDETPAGGTATADVDYVATSGISVIDPGETEASIIVNVIGDTLAESAAETFFVVLSNPINTEIFDGLGEGRIINDDDIGGSALDVLLLFDDTASFQNIGPTVANAFPTIIANLQAAFPGGDLAFGMSRFEDYGGGVKPFILNQPIISDATPNFDLAINAALNRPNPNNNGNFDFPETAIEALFQVATGNGFDGNNDGDTTDSGPAGLVSTQIGNNPEGDVPAYSTFTPDPTGDPAGPVLPPTDPITTNGVGFRPGAQHLVLLATDAGFVFEPDGVDPYVGVGGVTVPASQLTASGTAATPQGRGASIQATINELITDGIQVIGLGGSSFFGNPPLQELRGLAILTDAVNRTTSTIESGITPGPSADDIAPGEPLVFQINLNDPAALAAAIVSGITGAAENIVPLPPPPPPPPPIPGMEDDTMRGGSGDDTILAGDGNDLLEGNSGNDLISAGNSADTVFGGSGDDTIDGGSGDDVLDGGTGDDIVGGGANEDIYIWDGEGDGNDFFFSTTGADQVTVTGGDTNDSFVIGRDSGHITITEGIHTLTISTTIPQISLNGGLGNDTITIQDLGGIATIILTVNGGEGDDVINGAGADSGNVKLRLNGGPGDDVITGTDGEETISGGDGADVLNGGDGNDTVMGDAGDDVINGGKGDDVVEGGDNNDSILGGRGNDTLRGGLGKDTLNGETGDDKLEGNDGDDKLIGKAGKDTLIGGLGNDKLFGGSSGDSLDGNDGNDSIRGQGGDDIVHGGDGNDKILGNAGNDILIGGDGDDVVEGGSGNDGITGGNGDDRLVGEDGDDTLVGGDGDDTQTGGAGDDILLGDEGNDLIRGRGGVDTLQGGEGDDTIVGQASEIDETFELSLEVLELLELI